MEKLNKDIFLLISRFYLKNNGKILNLILINKKYKDIIERNLLNLFEIDLENTFFFLKIIFYKCAEESYLIRIFSYNIKKLKEGEKHDFIIDSIRCGRLNLSNYIIANYMMKLNVFQILIRISCNYNYPKYALELLEKYESNFGFSDKKYLESLKKLKNFLKKTNSMGLCKLQEMEFINRCYLNNISNKQNYFYSKYDNSHEKFLNEWIKYSDLKYNDLS